MRKASVHFEMARDIEAPANKHESVYVRNAKELSQKVLQMRKDGLEKLSIFSDFDFTLNRKTLGPLCADNSFNVLERVSKSTDDNTIS